MSGIEVKLFFERSTKGTHLYKASNTSQPVKSIYIQREAFSGEPPVTLVLKISLE